MVLTAIDLSQELLLSVKKSEDVLAVREKLATINALSIQQLLDDDNKKIAFWVNIYNSFIQLMIKEQPELYAHKNKFYTKRIIQITGTLLSFDDIEHGILRKRKFKYGLGYIPSFFDSSFVLTHQVESLDFRIHFALNCGAKSCPPIAFYTPSSLATELELATQSFLENETEYIEDQNVVYVTKLMLWFLGDFGGRKGILDKLKTYKIIPDTSQPKIRFKDYDWTLLLNNYK